MTSHSTVGAAADIRLIRAYDRSAHLLGRFTGHDSYLTSVSGTSLDCGTSSSLVTRLSTVGAVTDNRMARAHNRSTHLLRRFAGHDSYLASVSGTSLDSVTFSSLVTRLSTVGAVTDDRIDYRVLLTSGTTISGQRTVGISLGSGTGQVSDLALITSSSFLGVTVNSVVSLTSTASTAADQGLPLSSRSGLLSHLTSISRASLHLTAVSPRVTLISTAGARTHHGFLLSCRSAAECRSHFDTLFFFIRRFRSLLLVCTTFSYVYSSGHTS